MHIGCSIAEWWGISNINGEPLLVCKCVSVLVPHGNVHLVFLQLIGREGGRLSERRDELEKFN